MSNTEAGAAVTESENLADTVAALKDIQSINKLARNFINLEGALKVVAGYQQNVSELKLKIEKLKTESEEAATALSGANNEIKKAREEKELIRTTADVRLEEIKLESNKVQEIKESLNTDVTALNEKIESLNETVAEKEQSCEDLDSRYENTVNLLKAVTQEATN